MRDILLKAKSINFTQLLKNVRVYINGKRDEVKKLDFLILCPMVLLSIFSIPDMDNIFVTITRVIFVLMSLGYIMLEIYRFSKNGIKFNGFIPVISENWSLADKVLWSILSLYLVVLFSSINLFLFSVAWIFITISKISKNKYN